jgi:probable rRNA maturation factor
MILNRQRRVRIPVAELNRFLGAAQKRLRVPPGAVTIALVTDREMKKWNRAFRGKNRPTDVLSFPVDGPAKTQPSHSRRARPKSPPRTPLGHYLGDIAIAPAVAQRNARHYHRAFSTEMRILILHGILHLLGYDHETDHGQMDRREARVRRDLGLA